MVSNILPTGFNIGTQSISVPTNKTGGTAVGITAATSVANGQPITQTRPFSAMTVENLSYEQRSVPKALTGAGHASHATTATPGTFAYNQVAGTYLIRTYCDTITGSGNTALQSAGGEQHLQRRGLKQKELGASLLAAHRAGYWEPIGIARQRTNWSTTPTALTNTFKSTTNNSTDSDDQALYVTYRSVPGELVYRDGSPSPILDDYKAITG